MSDKQNEIENIAIDLVDKIRRLHFQEGTAKSERTKRIKEIIEANSNKVFKDVT